MKIEQFKKLVKFIIVILLVPYLSFSQSINFTEEENQYVESFFSDIKNREYDIPFEEAIDLLEEALEKVPYHPDLVYQILHEKYAYGDREYVVNYCSKLDKKYLFSNQKIVEIYFNSALLLEKFKLIQSETELVESQSTKNLFKSYIAYEENEIEDFVKFGIDGIKQQYKFLNPLKQNILNLLVIHYYVIDDFDSIYTILTNYFDYPVKDVTELETLIIFHQVAVINDEYSMGKDILQLIENMYPNEHEILSIFQAETFASSGYKYLAEEALIKSISFTEDEVNELFIHFGVDYFEQFFRVIINIDDSNVQIKLVNEILKTEKYRNSSYLLMSLVLAPQDLSKSIEYFNKFENNKNEVLLDIFISLLKTDYELAQKRKNYEKINTNLSYLSDATSEVFFLLYQIKLQLIANYKTPDYQYDYNKMLDQLEKIKKQATSDLRLNETTELLTLIASYYVDKEKALDILSNCQFCNYYDKESLTNSIKDDSKFLIINTLENFEYLEDIFYTNFKHYLFLKLVE